ncbi:MAG TPA: histidinol dehydrogenase [Planctomycetota bacterium]|nr:histidinol dehydrogenase [Planctomycetota bacterium]
MKLIEVGTPAEIAALVRKGESSEDDPEVDARARAVIQRVRAGGDRALVELTRELDGADLREVRVPDPEIDAALERTPRDVRKALELCAQRIRAFARHQRRSLRDFRTTTAGVTLGQRVVPLGRAGVYVPGGRYPLPSTALMGAIPARAAGVRSVAVATPPARETGRPRDVVLAACRIARVDEVYAIGGAQAVAALAFGTESVRPVDKIVGPGNVYVQAAKRLVAGSVGTDLPAGPSEALVLAEPGADPELAAWDMVAQCEHDPRARAWLVTWSRELAESVGRACEAALLHLETREVAAKALEASALIVVPDEKTAVLVSEAIGPEHLAVHAEDPRRLEKRLRNYGALFLGPLAAIPLGDFVLGPNHTLPTGGASRFAGGLSALHFVTVRTQARVERAGFERLEGAARTMASAEGLAAHERAVAVRRRRSKKT